MELIWLEDFVALEQTENFSRAAAMRHISQSAFSRRIQALENWIGAPLFIRESRRVRLSAAGHQFKMDAALLIRDIYQSRKNAIETAARENATLHFAATHTLSSIFFPHWISRLEKLGMPSDIYLISDTLQTCEQAFTQGQVQFLLSYAHSDTTLCVGVQSYPYRVIGYDVLMPFCAPGSDGTAQWLLPGSPSCPVQLLRYSQASGFNDLLENTRLNRRELHSHPSQLTSHFTSHLASVLLSLACEGQGIAWLPQSLAAQALKEKRLVVAGDDSWHIPLEILLYRRAGKMHQAAENFWQICGLKP